MHFYKVLNILKHILQGIVARDLQRGCVKKKILLKLDQYAKNYNLNFAFAGQESKIPTGFAVNNFLKSFITETVHLFFSLSIFVAPVVSAG